MAKTSADYPPKLTDRHKTTRDDILLWLETMQDDSKRWHYSKERKQKIKRSGKGRRKCTELC